MEKRVNHLINEKSPYLRQHLDNPVDWYPWGDDAFTKAANEDKPILLSIGYSTCHWCHVMAHESFENSSIAQLMNEWFVSIKVDREERPDIDHIYMSAVQSFSGQGGWPLTAFLTPDRKPFYGGTYYPPYAKWGNPGFIDVLRSIHHAWESERKDILISAESIHHMLKNQSSSLGNSGVELTDSVFQKAFEQYHAQFDSLNGGFSSAPKFPMGHSLSFLLMLCNRFKNDSKSKDCWVMLEKTLDAIANGGIYDHLGGGFHRYSTDSFWQIPHFEKMLYDQALLTQTYLEAYQCSKKKEYLKVVSETFDYVLRDLTDELGGFYSAEDADSLSSKGELSEGSFYTWSYEEIKDALNDKELFDLAVYRFGLNVNGNAKQDPHGDFVSKNILYVAHTEEDAARKFNQSIEEISQKIKNIHSKLYFYRKGRQRPHLDNKILVDWNGLMIASLAIGSKVLNQSGYYLAAKKAAEFIISEMFIDGNLYHRYCDGHVGIEGKLEDYAFFIYGLLSLYETNGEFFFLEQAKLLTDTMINLFKDKDSAGFFLNKEDQADMIIRPKTVYDGAVPSGNAIAVFVLQKMNSLLGKPIYASIIEEYFKGFSKMMLQYPLGHVCSLSVFELVNGSSCEIIVVGEDEKQLSDGLNIIYSYFMPNKTVIIKRENNYADTAFDLISYLQNYNTKDNGLTVYICQNQQCAKPLVGKDQIQQYFNQFN